MSHSKIYQLATKPISKDDYVSPENFYENHEPWADYIGEKVKDEDRDEYIGYLANLLEDVFTYKGDGEFAYKGADAMRKFLTAWADELRRMAGLLTPDNVLKDLNLWKVRHCCTDTHKDTSKRFYIREWNGWAGPFADVIEWAANQLKKGDRIYVGAIIDFHY